MATSSSNWKPIGSRQWLHGTPVNKDWTSFKPRTTNSTKMEYGFGVHFTKDPKLADFYAKAGSMGRSRNSSGSNVKSVIFNKPLNILNANKIYDKGSLGFNAIRESSLVNRKLSNFHGKASGSWFGSVSPKSAVKSLLKHGFDAVLYENVVSSPGVRSVGYKPRTLMTGKALAVVNPSKYRLGFK